MQPHNNDASPALPERAGQPTRLRRHLIAVAIVTLGALGLRLYDLGGESFWLDEGATYCLSQRIDALWSNRAAALCEPTPPLYYAMMHHARWLGRSEAAYRLPSVVFGVLTVPVIYGLGLAAAGLRGGVAASSLLALHPWHVHYSQEARCYAILIFAASTVLLTLTLLLERAASDRPKRNRRWLWTGYVVFAALCCCLHTAGMVVVFALAISVLVVWAVRSRRMPFLRAFVIANIIVVLACSWWLAMLYAQVGHFRSSWVPWPTARVAWQATFNWFALSRMPLWAQVGLVPAMAAVATLGFLRRRVSPALLLMAVAWVGYVATVWILSVKRPIMLPRVMLWASVPFFVLVAAGLARVRSTALFAAGLAALLAALGAGQHLYWTQRQKPDWRAACAQLAERARPGDALLLISHTAEWPVRFYIPDLDARFGDRLYKLDTQPALSGIARLYDGSVLRPDQLHLLRERHERLWVLARMGEWEVPAAAAAALKRFEQQAPRCAVLRPGVPQLLLVEFDTTVRAESRPVGQP